MLSSKQFLCLVGLILLCFVIYTEQQQQAISNDESNIKRHRVDSHIQPSFPFFRGSNLGYFVRKRPFASISERSLGRQTELDSSLDTNAAETMDHPQQQRRFDDYSENPGPMFG